MINVIPSAFILSLSTYISLFYFEKSFLIFINCFPLPSRWASYSTQHCTLMTHLTFVIPIAKLSFLRKVQCLIQLYNPSLSHYLSGLYIIDFQTVNQQTLT